MKTYNKMRILGIVLICSLLLGFILFPIGEFKKIPLLIFTSVILMVISFVLATLYDRFKEKSHKEDVCSQIPCNEFVKLNFKKRNDQIVDEVFKNADVFCKRTENDIVVFKIEIFNNEIVIEMPLEEAIKKFY